MAAEAPKTLEQINPAYFQLSTEEMKGKTMVADYRLDIDVLGYPAALTQEAVATLEREAAKTLGVDVSEIRKRLEEGQPITWDPGVKEVD